MSDPGTVTFQRVCSRCGAAIGEPVVSEIAGDLGSVALPVGDKRQDGLCAICRLAPTTSELRAFTDEHFAMMSTGQLLACLSVMPELHRERRKRAYALITAARRAGMTWQVIADSLGLDSRQAAQFRWKQLDREFGDQP